jgi:hypothetical protein
MDHILIESKLSDGAKTLWMILYRGAGLNVGMKCEASVSFLKNMTGKSDSTLWRLIKELRTRGYLDVETREGLDGKNLPNIYGPRLPATAIKVIKDTATPREVVSDQLGFDYITATTRDYENSIGSEVDCETEHIEDVKVHRKALSIDSKSDLAITSNLTAVSIEAALKEGSIGEVEIVDLESFTSYIGESVKTGTQYTNPPTEGYTKIRGHSRDSWKMYPHIRTEVSARLDKMGFSYDRTKQLISEIDWTLNFGSMSEWGVQKGINVCLSLNAKKQWQTPNWA